MAEERNLPGWPKETGQGRAAASVAVWDQADQERHLADDMGMGGEDWEVLLEDALAAGVGDRHTVHPASVDPDKGEPLLAVALWA